MTPAPVAQLALYFALGAIAVPLGHQVVHGLGMAARAVARRVRARRLRRRLRVATAHARGGA